MVDNLNSLEVVQRLQEYIDEHIQEKMTLGDLAKFSGYSPYQYHKKTPPIQLFLPEGALSSYRAIKQARDAKMERMECDMKTVFVQIIEKPERKCLMKRGEQATEYFAYCEEVGCDVWEVPMDYDKSIPEGYELVSLPAYTVMVFQGEPYEDDEMFAQAITEVWEHIDKFDPTLYGYEWDSEAGPRFQFAPMGHRGYIEGRPVKKR